VCTYTVGYNLTFRRYSFADFSVPNANSSRQAFYKPGSVFTLQLTELSDFKMTHLNLILGVQQYELCHVELNQGQLKGQM
jgi:hypothetical protein